RSEPSVWTHPLCLSPCVQVVTDSLARHFDSKKFLRNELRRSQCADVALRDGTRVEGPRWPKRDHRGYGWPRPPFRHLIISGGVSTIGLKSYDRGREAFQGANLDWGWADEEAPLDVYSELLTRCNVGGGPVWTTFTPLLGFSQVVRRFLIEKS